MITFKYIPSLIYEFQYIAFNVVVFIDSSDGVVRYSNSYNDTKALHPSKNTTTGNIAAVYSNLSHNMLINTLSSNSHTNEYTSIQYCSTVHINQVIGAIALFR